MSAKALYQTFFFIVAFTLVSGQVQYLVKRNFKDSQCTVADVGIRISTSSDCIASTTCDNTTLGVFTTEECVDSPPSLGADNAIFSIYPPSSGCTGNADYRFSAPLDVCWSGSSIVYKFSGCTAQNSSFILFKYYNLADCQSNTGDPDVEAYVDGQCTTVVSQYKGECPAAAPISAPVASPVSAAPVSSTPTSTSTPQAATPVKKASNAAYNAVLGITSIVAVLLSWA